MDGSWKHVEEKKGKQKRTHTVWLHSYKVQELVKLIYDVKTQARSSTWGEGYWGASNVSVSWLAVLTWCDIC